MYKTIKKKEEAIFIEKKSKFIAELYPIKSKEEAEETIQSIRKKYYDAKHHCYAYRIKTETETIEKSSDDGEPSGTAGSPMLHVLQREELFNVLIVVTRYFGGILLGTGGLVRAYTQAMQNAIAKAEFVQEENGYWIEITIPYNKLGKCQFYCKKQHIEIINIQYEENIKITLQVTKKEKEKIEKERQNLGFYVKNITIFPNKIIQKNIEK